MFKYLVLANNDARAINNNEQGNILNLSFWQCTAYETVIA